MITTAFIIGLALQSSARDKPSIQFSQGTFAIHARGDVESAPLQADPIPIPKYVAFRKNGAFAVWDERGLTIRHGEKSMSSHLPEIPLSPRAFPRDEIRKTLERIRAGECMRDAAALSGAKRIGKDAFLLVRWEDKNGKPWAEALVQVDLDSDSVRPRFLGRFVGLSSADKSIDDRLLIVHGKLGAITHTKDSWGLSTYDPSTQEFKTQPMGATLQSLIPINSTEALFVETSAYGTTIAGRVDTGTGTRKILYEGREQVRFIDAASPEIVLASASGKSKLVNCLTGSVRLIPYKIDAKRVGKDILLWSEPDKPAAAWLMSPDAWTTLATWRSPN